MRFLIYVMRVYFIDHYDSFSFNLIEWFRVSSPEIEIIRIPYDEPRVLERISSSPAPLILSPGPKSPEDVPSSLELCQAMIGKVPILGVCLGHQILGVALGGKIIKSFQPFHGSVRTIIAKDRSRIFDCPSVFAATYNSLCIDRRSVSERYVTSTNTFGEVETLEVYDFDFCAIGVQFHPESFLSKHVDSIRLFWTSELKRYFFGKKVKREKVANVLSLA